MEELTTTHRFHTSDARNMDNLPGSSIDLVVTSPPYPMIEMWDAVFSELNPAIGKHLEKENADLAYDLMHRQLDNVWTEVNRVLKPGGMACINIGDATRTMGGEFRLFPSHSSISMSMRKLGFYELPSIVWKKQTNSPNKFLGSGTMPPGAYVTLEHEFILIFRKPPKREFPGQEAKNARAVSSYFWEERNAWFTDIWEDLKGARQDMQESVSRARSGAFPFELPYRLINMFSLIGDKVLDPFAGTGTTAMAAAAGGRSSCGYELDPHMASTARNRVKNSIQFINSVLQQRLSTHRKYVNDEVERGRSFQHWNSNYGFKVKTAPEEQLKLFTVKDIIEEEDGLVLKVLYEVVTGNSGTA